MFEATQLQLGSHPILIYEPILLRLVLEVLPLGPVVSGLGLEDLLELVLRLLGGREGSVLKGSI